MHFAVSYQQVHDFLLQVAGASRRPTRQVFIGDQMPVVSLTQDCR